MKDSERFILEFRPEPARPGQPDPMYRLRGLPKVALRRFGLRCVCVDVKPSTATAKDVLSRDEPNA